MVEVLQWGYRTPFCSAPPLSSEPIPFPSHIPSSIRGKTLEREVVSLVEKVRSSWPPSLSRLLQLTVCGAEGLRVMEARHRPIHVEPSRSQASVQDGDSPVCASLGGDWMVSLDLKDAYLQVPIIRDSRKFLRFVAIDQVYQFKALCFDLSTAPQVFMRFMVPGSTFLHHARVRIRRYLDDWLIQAPSCALALQALD